MRPASTTVIAALTVGATYLAGLATLAGSDGEALIEALFLLASLGLLFPLLAWALAYSVVIIAPVGVLFGVLWARTRSLWLVVPLHGAVDLLPQLAPFLRTWAGLPG